MSEVWREVPGFPGYEASDQGRVRSWRGYGRGYGAKRKTPRMINPATTSQYPYIGLRLNKKAYYKKVHTIVLTTFCGPRPDGMECCHENGDPYDNRLVNLRWDTRGANAQDMILHGRSLRGTKHHKCKLTEDKVRAIRDDPRGAKMVAKDFGICENNVYMIRGRHTWAWLD